MAAPPGTQFYTYRPQPNVPGAPLGQGNLKNQPMNAANTLSLKPGETLGFQSGRGYYAVPGAVQPPSGPAAPAPAAPATPQFNMPDYSSLIQGDYGYQQAQAQGQQALAQGETDFQKALRTAFIDLGAQDTSKLGEWAKYIDQPTIEAAKANKFAALAQNLQQATKSLRQNRAALAARGILSSGQTTQDTLTNQQAREQGDYGALRSFLSGTEQSAQGLAGLRSSIAAQISAAREAAAARAAAAYQPQVGVPTTAPTDTAGTPWGGISWGGRSGITTKAQLLPMLNVPYAQWAKNHAAAAARLG